MHCAPSLSSCIVWVPPSSFAAGESEIKEKEGKFSSLLPPLFLHNVLLWPGPPSKGEENRSDFTTLPLLSFSRTDRGGEGYKCIITEFNWRTLSSPLYYCEIAEGREGISWVYPHRYYWASLRRRQGTTFGEEYYYFFCSLSLFSSIFLLVVKVGGK